MKTHRVTWTIAVACLSVVVAGCGGSSSGSSGSPAGALPGGGGKPSSCGSAEPGLCTTIDVTGAVTLHGTFNAGLNGGDRLIETCAEYVKGDTDKARLSLPIALGVTVDGHNLGIANRVSKNYAGPRTYERKELGALDGGVHVDIDHKSYQINDSATATAEISPDGSGKLTFTNLREATNSSDSSPKGTINGNYTWTCHD
jgi:hypothetical protein